MELVGCIVLALIATLFCWAIYWRRGVSLLWAGVLLLICGMLLGAGVVSLVFEPDTGFAVPLVALALADIALTYYYLIVVRRVFERR